jgi:hypothetical protein
LRTLSLFDASYASNTAAAVEARGTVEAKGTETIAGGFSAIGHEGRLVPQIKDGAVPSGGGLGAAVGSAAAVNGVAVAAVVVVASPLAAVPTASAETAAPAACAAAVEADGVASCEVGEDVADGGALDLDPLFFVGGGRGGEEADGRTFLRVVAVAFGAWLSMSSATVVAEFANTTKIPSRASPAAPSVSLSKKPSFSAKPAATVTVVPGGDYCIIVHQR